MLGQVCCKVLCHECEPLNDYQALYNFIHLVLHNLWMQSEGNAMVLGPLDNEFQTAYHYEEDDGEKDSNGSERIELDSHDYWDSFIIGEKEQLEWWYLKNRGPQLQLYYTNEDYYEDQVEDGEAESDVDAKEEEAQADVEANQGEAQANEYYYQDQVKEQESEADVHAEVEEAEASKSITVWRRSGLSVCRVVPTKIHKRRDLKMRLHKAGMETETTAQCKKANTPDAFPWGAGHGTLRWTRASEQAGKALRSQGHQCAHVM